MRDRETRPGGRKGGAKRQPSDGGILSWMYPMYLMYLMYLYPE